MTKFPNSYCFKGGKLTSLSSKEEEKKKQKPTRGVGRKKGGDPSLRRH